MITTVLVHKGLEYPSYISDCIDQFFIFNPRQKLYLITDEHFSQIDDLKSKYSSLVNVLTFNLVESKRHKFFKKWNLMNSSFRGGFWRFAIERFFVLQDFMETFGVTDVLHFEYDNTVYFSVEELAGIFKETSKGISVPVDSVKRCIPSVVYIKDVDAIDDFCKVYNRYYLLRKFNDMRAFSAYSSFKRSKCSLLPVVPSTYKDGRHHFRSASGLVCENLNLLDNDFNSFSGVFDAAAFGQFLGGIDPRNDAKIGPGFVNETALYSPEEFTVLWKKDKMGRLFPLLGYNEDETRLFNLHVHSKELFKFRSDRLGY